MNGQNPGLHASKAVYNPITPFSTAANFGLHALRNGENLYFRQYPDLLHAHAAVGYNSGGEFGGHYSPCSHQALRLPQFHSYPSKLLYKECPPPKVRCCTLE